MGCRIMPNWNDLLEEVKHGSSQDILRRNYLSKLSDYTNRNTIVYYSGWLDHPSIGNEVAITEADKNGFISVCHDIEKSKGLDLLLHTPGGDIAATESIIKYLKSLFNSDIRVIVPQIAMSAGTMIALSGKEIIMGVQSSLGPIDPQIGIYPAHGILEEWNQAKRETIANPATTSLWQVVVSKYNPTILGECEKSIKWSEEIASDCLKTGMFSNDENAEEKIKRILKELGDHALTKAHNRHISIDKAKEIGLIITDLSSDPGLEDAVMSVHHACMITLNQTVAIKLIENNLGVSYIKQAMPIIAQ